MQRATDPPGRIPSLTQSEGGSHGFPALRRLPPDLTARFTPGTLIFSCEVFKVLRRGLDVLFRKRNSESSRRISELKA